MQTERRSMRRDAWLSRLAWVVWVINVALLVCELYIDNLPPSILLSLTFRQISLWTFSLIAATMAALVASRRPTNPVGWWLGVYAFAFIGIALGSTYSKYALERSPGGLPAGELALWLAAWCAVPMIISLICLLMLFPSGRLLSSQWRPVIWLAVAGVALRQVEVSFTPGSISLPIFSIPTNPFAIAWVPAIPGRGTAGLALFVISSILCLAALIRRFQRAHGAERQQLKWFALGAGWLPVLFAAGLLAQFLPTYGPRVIDFLLIVLYFVLLLLPVAMTIGILRYRLFEIDVIINRTLVYSIVTPLLAAAFAGLSVIAQHLTLAATGQESQAAVIVAALVATALFQPLRARVQILVDRRFYRTKYDASLTLETFAGQLRHEVELDHLTYSLVAVVQDTMRPTHASLWLRPRPPPAGAREPNS